MMCHHHHFFTKSDVKISGLNSKRFLGCTKGLKKAMRQFSDNLIIYALEKKYLNFCLAGQNKTSVWHHKSPMTKDFFVVERVVD